MKETFDNSLDHVGEILHFSHVMSFNKSEASPTSLQKGGDVPIPQTESVAPVIEHLQEEAQVIQQQQEEGSKKRKREEEGETNETNAKRHKKNTDQK